jgi:pyridoxine/pyridoxamine 5'-phosphate oxidase
VARGLIRDLRFCVLSTVTPDGQPWVSPLFYNYDDAYRIIFESAKDSRHCSNIAVNPRVAIVIARLLARDPLVGVYLECEAREVPVEGLAEALEVFKHGPHGKRESESRQVSDYLGDKPLRLYEAVHRQAYVLTQVRTPDGYTIDQRIEINLV